MHLRQDEKELTLIGRPAGSWSVPKHEFLVFGMVFISSLNNNASD